MSALRNNVQQRKRLWSVNCVETKGDDCSALPPPPLPLSLSLLPLGLVEVGRDVASGVPGKEAFLFGELVELLRPVIVGTDAETLRGVPDGELLVRPVSRGLHSSTSQLNVSTFRGICWVPTVDIADITRHKLDTKRLADQNGLG